MWRASRTCRRWRGSSQDRTVRPLQTTTANKFWRIRRRRARQPRRSPPPTLFISSGPCIPRSPVTYCQGAAGNGKARCSQCGRNNGLDSGVRFRSRRRALRPGLRLRSSASVSSTTRAARRRKALPKPLNGNVRPSTTSASPANSGVSFGDTDRTFAAGGNGSDSLRNFSASLGRARSAARF
jgi:hypothetical protein